MIGKTLGHFRVGEQLGRGGMGEVYVAEDLSLDRKVALKFLPDAFTGDPERMARFEREAKVLASLNHVNIAGIYGLEQAEGKRFIVMELVEGETLAQRLSKGPLPIDESLGICRQIAEGLEAAHEKGVIHRDLKPANVMIVEEDKVKILDFGLAKALSDEIQGVDSSHSPTLTEAMTQPGIILGTAAYMSPEQAKGKTIDKRADIWAFGCILYELLTGKSAFDGETVTETLAAILRGEPDMDALPEQLPPGIRMLLRRCLQKDPKHRFHHVGDVKIQLEEGAGPVASPAISVGGKRRRYRTIPIAAAVLIVLIAAVAAGIGGWMLKPSPSRAAVARVSVNLPLGSRLPSMDYAPITLSPDGRLLAYVAMRGGARQLNLRSIDTFETKVIAGADGARAPFFSPDGRWIGFFAGGKLKKVSVAGGPVQTLCDAPVGLGGSWGPDGTIYFAPFNISGLWKVSAEGGKPDRVTSLDRGKGEVSHRWPQVLPGGKAVLFTVWTGPGWEEKQTVAQPLQDGERIVLVRGGESGRYVSTGHIIYAYDRQLMAVSFDPSNLRVSGTPARLAEEVTNEAEGADFSISEAGSLAYIAPSEPRGAGRLVWVDREGRAEALAAPARDYNSVRLSPDGLQIAATIEGPTTGVWIYDLARLTLTRLNTEQGSSQFPIWTPDGKRIVYRGTRRGFRNLFWKSSDGSGLEERLTSGEGSEDPYSFSSDGRFLVYETVTQETGVDTWMLSMEGERKPQPILRNTFYETSGTVSPDGRYLAYYSDESGRGEIYIQPFMGSGGKLQVSTDGGADPVWNRNGRELFYRNGDKMMSVGLTTTPTLKAASPRLLFEGVYNSGAGDDKTYDISPDGRRFLMIKGNEQKGNTTQIQVVLNWFEELKRRVPVK